VVRDPRQSSVPFTTPESDAHAASEPVLRNSHAADTGSHPRRA
jgi:hypothetical protein